MNILTHCKVSLEVLKNRKLTPRQEAQLLLGSILPDISDFQFVPFEKTHYQGLKFLKFLARMYHYLGAGVILHGEKPKGLDYYAHRPKGYIEKKQKEILKIMKYYKKVFPKKTDFHDVAHILIEFCFEHLTAEKNSRILNEVGRAIKNPVLTKVVYNFANFFNIERKHVKIMLRIGKAETIEKFIYNFRTVKGTAHNFQNFIFLKGLRDKNHKPNWLKRLTKSSYGFIKSRIKERQFEQLFARCVEIIRKDYNPFISKVVRNLKKLVKEKKL